MIAQRGFNWIHLVNDSQFKEYVGSNGYPLTIVIDKAGKVAQVEYGSTPLQREALLRTIQSLR